jgi:hypothetical protein
MKRVIRVIGLLGLSSLIITSTACRRYRSAEESVIKIIPQAPLVARLGTEVRWSFKAEIDGHPIRVIDVGASRLPFGAKIDKENGEYLIRGKILGRQFRGGTVTVVAFDEEGCRQSIEDSKKVAGKNALATGAQDVAIPLQECDANKISGIPMGRENFYSARFTWQFDDSPDQMDVATYGNYFKTIMCGEGQECQRGIFRKLELPQPPKNKKITPQQILSENDLIFYTVIPPFEAPHTGDMLLGECAQYPRKFCGRGKNCLWTGKFCVSADVTGLAPENEGGQVK